MNLHSPIPEPTSADKVHSQPTTISLPIVSPHHHRTMSLRPTLQTAPRRALAIRTLASHAYNPPRLAGPPGPPQAGPSTTPRAPNPATVNSPEHLKPEQRRLLEEIVRVDHAGELGANWIYRGQKWASSMRGDRQTAEQVEVSWRDGGLLFDAR